MKIILIVSSRSVVLFLLMGLLQSTTVHAQASDSRILEYRSEARLGYGWDALRNRPTAGRATCLAGFNTSEQQVLNPKTDRWFRLVESKSDIMDSFNLSVEAAFQGVVYAVEGSVDFAISQNLSHTYLQVAGGIDTQTSTQSLITKAGSGNAGLRIAGPYLSMLTSEDPRERAQFARDCGNGFITDIQRGGTLNVVLTIVTDSQESKLKIAGKLKGSGPSASVDISAVLDLVRSTSGTNVSGQFHAVGGIIKEADLSSVEGVEKMLNAFAEAVANDDAGRTMVVQSYQSLVPDAAGEFNIPAQALAAARDYLELEAAWRKMDAVWSEEAALTVDYGRSPTRQCLGIRKDQLRRQLDAKRALLQRCGAGLLSVALDGAVESCKTLTVAARDTADTTGAGSNCPALPMLGDGQNHTAYDYMTFLPPVAPADSSACSPNENLSKTGVWNSWIKPAWRADCAREPGRPICQSTFEAKALASIPVLPRPNMFPGGTYGSTCRACKLAFKGNGKAEMRCGCRDWNKVYQQTSVQITCPPTTRYANCNGVLTAGDTCK